MSAESIIMQGRLFAERQMTDTVLITRPSAQAVLNPETGNMEHTVSTVYSGPALIKFNDSEPTRTDEAGKDLTISDAEVRLPVTGTGDVQADDICTVTASQMDPEMAGTKFRIAGPYWKTYSTQRRFRAEIQS